MKLTPWEPDLRSVVDRIDEGEIDLQPEFQRQEVWQVSKKRRLIDTIIRNWSMPPIHLVVTPGDKLEVLDGQQRLASIRDFLHDEFAIDGRIAPSDPQITNLHGTFYSKLDSSTKRRIDRYSIRSFIISDYTPEEPSELFYRLNQPTMLTAGEQRNALYGPAREQLKELVETFEQFGNSKSSIGFSNVRLAYDDIMARLLFFLEAGTFGVKSTESRISDRFRSRHGFPDDVFVRAIRSVALFSRERSALTSARFNKASILSWLLFYSRFANEEPRPLFLEQFFMTREKRHDPNFVHGAVSLFDDRASLRVTDVSSVVYRDFSLWYAYKYLSQGTLPHPIPSSLIYHVRDILLERDDASFEDAVAQHLDIEHWSGLL